jgi:hypothetical protein
MKRNETLGPTVLRTSVNTDLIRALVARRRGTLGVWLVASPSATRSTFPVSTSISVYRMNPLAGWPRSPLLADNRDCCGNTSAQRGAG